ncbi:uncharacterized protein B0J16DRAFT_52428 [Fusarium flagelliforme]|uniref:uncharacterized protein n=1 Tax=Fusarium flagelliforme TaxID=2675880 RepID=UPI001E8CB1AC|nr:uncharacterized protein B0J16DRAFT_52428 [Fusarium flagelliforme]KAH7191984.1 hypothetical protein B0J16DRAFT_52428 [Fusarium flagelliforme]
MEPVSLALGVLPIVGGAVKTCKVVRKKLKIFRHYSRELRRVQKRVSRQSQVFTNELHLLLRPCVNDEDVVESMLKDERHPKWSSKELEDGMRRSLGESYSSCRELIEDIGSTMADLQSVFDCFDQILDQCDENEQPRDAMRRLREATRITYDESKLEAHIKDLNQSIEELRQLREQTQELRKPVATAPRRTIRMQTDPEYNHFRKTKEASKALHEAFTTVWSNNGGHGMSPEMQHIVRLFLHTNVEEDVNMNAAITCDGHGMGTSIAARERAIRVTIRSQNRDPSLGLPASPNSNQSSSSHDGQRKRRKVRFAEAGASILMDQDQPCCSSKKLQVVELLPDLSMVDLCSVLYKEDPLTSISSIDGYCLGYLDGDMDGKFRHHFYKNLTHTHRETMSTTSDNAYETLIPMSEALNSSAERSISIVDQLKIAREIASAVLKLHATPWLKDYFNIYDLMLYNTGHDLTTSLKTLHVASDFTKTILTQEQNNAAASSLPTPLTIDDALEVAKLLYGVRNLTLWSLGAILLQVGQWSTLQSLEDVITIRKLSTQASNLGPRYRDLTRKCLDCDFGYGDDLTKPRLQQAVYEGLVGELSEMISTLDVEED